MLSSDLEDFIMLMAFLGAIDFFMANSGLSDLWSTVYAGVSISHMILNARAIRHHVTCQALSSLLLENVFLTEQEIIQVSNDLNTAINFHKPKDDSAFSDIPARFETIPNEKNDIGKPASL